jgi:[ribosomal protein S5]-alanine N-acetyltransferase
MFDPWPLPGGVVLRPIELTDAAALYAAQLRNRDHLRDHEPARPATFWTEAGHREHVAAIVQRRIEGAQLACAMFRGDRVVGRAALNTIVLGPFRSASLGYWIDAEEVGRGLASAATAALCEVGRSHVGLHRIEASVFPSNVASQRVLAKNGFEQIGHARNYLFLAGAWQDADIFQRILHHDPPPAP